MYSDFFDEDNVKEILVQKAEKLTEEEVLNFFVDDLIGKKNLTNIFSGKNQILLEGNRGIGKSMVLKFIAAVCDKEFNKQKVLAIYTTFEESLKIERIKLDEVEYNPFNQWLSIKILNSIYDKTIQLGLTEDKSKLRKFWTYIFPETPEEKIGELLRQLKENLEDTPITKTKKIKEINLNSIKKIIGGKYQRTEAKTILANIENISIIRKAVQNLISEFKIKRVLFLFDEAAHILVEEQQGMFFAYFKSLYSTEISCVAAVYPLITNYGDKFEPLEDAKIIRLDLAESDYEKYSKYFDRVIERRWSDSSENLKILKSNPKEFELIKFAAMGNTRNFYELIDRIILDDKYHPINQKNTKLLIRNYVNTDLLNRFKNATKKIEKFEIAKDIGYLLVRELVLTSLRTRKRSNKPNRIYFGIHIIELEKNPQLKLVIDYLSYGKLISYRDIQSIENDKANIYALNIAMAIQENLIDSLDDIINLKLYNIPIININKIKKDTKNPKIFEPLEEILNLKIIDTIGTKSILEEVLKNDIAALLLGSFLTRKLISNKLKTLKDLYDMGNDVEITKNLRKIDQIGKMRSEKILTAYKEFLQS